MISVKKMGRYYWDKKDEADGLKNISVQFLKKHGYLPPTNKEYFYRYGNIKWSRHGEETGNISFKIIKDDIENECYINFIYTSTDRHTEESKEMDYKFNLLTTPCNLGGVRYWFQCGLSVNGQYCGKRVGKLYFGRTKEWLGCRHCNDLSYASKNENRRGRYAAMGRFFDAQNKIEEMESKIKRRYYNGKPTRKYRRLMELEMQYAMAGRAFMQSDWYKEISDK